MVGVDAELAFRQAESGNTSGITHSERVVQLQENYKDQVGLSPSLITTIPKHKSKDAPHKHTQGMG